MRNNERQFELMTPDEFLASIDKDGRFDPRHSALIRGSVHIDGKKFSGYIDISNAIFTDMLTIQDFKGRSLSLSCVECLGIIGIERIKCESISMYSVGSNYTHYYGCETQHMYLMGNEVRNENDISGLTVTDLLKSEGNKFASIETYHNSAGYRTRIESLVTDDPVLANQLSLLGTKIAASSDMVKKMMVNPAKEALPA